VALLVVVGVLASMLLVRWTTEGGREKGVLTRYAAGKTGRTVTSAADFTATFPTSPKYNAFTVGSSVNPVPVVRYVSTVGSETLSVLVGDYRGRSIDPRTLLDRSFRALVSGTGGKIVSFDRKSIDGQPAIDYVLRLKAGYAQGRELIVRGRYYEVQTTSTARRSIGYQRLLRSFRVLDA
jgi:hypothetical protein